MKDARIAVGAAAAALLIAASLSLRGEAVRPPPTSLAPDVPQLPEHCGGEQTTLSAANEGAPYGVTLPEGGDASVALLVAAWDCPSDGTLLEFSSGVTIVIQVNTVADPPTAWENLAKSDGDDLLYSVGRIGSIPAILIDPARDPDGDANGGVTFVSDGVYVSVGGDGEIPLAELVDVAEGLTVSLDGA